VITDQVMCAARAPVCVVVGLALVASKGIRGNWARGVTETEGRGRRSLPVPHAFFFLVWALAGPCLVIKKFINFFKFYVTSNISTHM
jgi:hypothetical protein